jgi:hypothetical protein
LRWPNLEHAGWRFGSFTQPADLAATLRELLGLPTMAAPDSWAGRSLLALTHSDDRLIRGTAVSGARRDGRTLWGYRTPSWYLMLDDSDSPQRLFVKPDDRWEVNDLQARNQELAEELEREFKTNFPV